MPVKRARKNDKIATRAVQSADNGRAIADPYLVRPDVDEALSTALISDQHVVICGDPERGKTSAYRRALAGTRYTVVTCAPGMQRYEIYRMLLAQMGVFLTMTRSRKRRRSKSASVSVFVEMQGNEDDRVEQTIDIDLTNVNDVLRIATQNQAPKTIVLERFETLPKRAIRGIARDLKTIFEQSEFRVVIVGVWTPPEVVHLLGSPFGRRYACVHVRDWTDDELKNLLEKWLERAGCSCDPTDVRAAIGASDGCPGMLKEITSAALQSTPTSKRTAPSRLPRTVIKTGTVEYIVEKLVKSWLPAYELVLVRLSSRDSRLWDGLAYLSKWILHCIIATDNAQLRLGLSVDTIADYVNQIHPNIGKCFTNPRNIAWNYWHNTDSTLEVVIGKPRRRGNTRLPFLVTRDQMVRESRRLRRAQRGRVFERPIMYYDTLDERIRVTDPRFLLILARTPRDQLLAMLPIFDEESEGFEPLAESEFQEIKVRVIEARKAEERED